MPVVMLVVLGLIIWAVVAGSRSAFWRGDSEQHGLEDSAMEVLKRRYARGEITRQEYEEKRKDLS